MTSVKRDQSRSEEVANSISHGLGLIAALAATPILLIKATRTGDVRSVVGASIFAASVLILYLGSTLYHSFAPGPAKRILRVVEHSAIYLLIAGTYTPFTLSLLGGTLGWILFALIWALACGGIVAEVFCKKVHPVFSTSLYIFMGWIIVFAFKPLLSSGLPLSGFFLLLAGGIAYTGGVAFYATDTRLRYGHFLWHLFVLTGTLCHYFAVYWYAL